MRDLIDAQFIAEAPRWHRRLDHAPHLTAEARERLEADMLFAGERGVEQ